MSRFPDAATKDIFGWARRLTEVAQNDSDEQGRRIRILDGKTVKEYTSEERDLLPNVNVGAIIYNKNLGFFQGYNGYGWSNFQNKPLPVYSFQRTLGNRSL